MKRMAVAVLAWIVLLCGVSSFALLSLKLYQWHKPLVALPVALLLFFWTWLWAGKLLRGDYD